MQQPRQAVQICVDVRRARSVILLAPVAVAEEDPFFAVASLWGGTRCWYAPKDPVCCGQRSACAATTTTTGSEVYRWNAGSSSAVTACSRCDEISCAAAAAAAIVRSILAECGLACALADCVSTGACQRRCEPGAMSKSRKKRRSQIPKTRQARCRTRPLLPQTQIDMARAPARP